MKRSSVFLALSVLVFALPSGFASAQTKSKKAQPRAEKTMATNNPQADAPFACNVNVMSAEERKHYMELSERLHSAVKETRELHDGYAFRLAGERDTIAMVAEWISFERLCCPFFTFQLEVAGESAPIWLRLTGREGVKEFMRSEFGIK